MKKSILCGVFLGLFATGTNAQNIFSGEPVQVVGSMNNYNTGSAFNTTYRRVSVNAGNPTDGRGQWVKTYNAQPSGGDVTNTNMAGGGGNGFLFISGPSASRFQNKWVFAGIGQARLDSINGISAYNSGQDMGLNMSTAGRYTFVFNDCGYTATNAQFYVGYTPNQPVQVSNASMQVLANNTLQLQLRTNTTPSPNERVFVRYTLNSNFGATSSSTVLACSSLNNPTDTLWQATLPAMNAGSTVTYYFFTSTLTQTQLNALNETGKSLCALQVLDNNGLNYQHSFVPKYNVVFNVDMAAFACVPFDSVTLVGNQMVLGNWSGWRRMNSNGTIHSDTLLLDSGAAVQFKFRYHRNGTTQWEANFSTVSGNREITIQKDTSLLAFCFGQQQTCPSFPPPSQVTFRVDLSRGVPNAQGRIYVMGNFTTPQWQQGALRLFPVAGRPGVFERTVSVCADTVIYKFMNGDSSVAANAETFPSPSQRSCTVSNGTGGFNRIFVRNGTQAQTLEYLFDSCMVAPVISKKTVRFRVNMERLACAGFDSVTITGNHVMLGNWSNSVRLKQEGISNIYSDTISFDSALAIQYKFRWHTNGAITWESNFTSTSGNRQLTVNTDTTLEVVCFNQLNNCSPLPAPSNITFRVDLSRGVPNAQGRIYVMGNFTTPQWQQGALRLFPVAGRPGVFERMVSVCADTVLYKFINGDSSVIVNAETFPSASQRTCVVPASGGGFNRRLLRNDSLPVVLEFMFDSCSPAPIIPKYQVVFQVNLEKQKCALPDSVTITGNNVILGNWAGSRRLHQITGTNIYTDTLLLDSGLALQYKFRTHRSGTTVWESDFATTSKNREFTITSSATIGPVCFGETGNCAPSNPPSLVRFRVDVSQVIPDAQGRVYVMGNFTQPQWMGGPMRMQQVSGQPGLFEITTQVCVDTVLYKFINGDSSVVNNAETFPNANERGCVVSNGLGGFNRQLIRNIAALTQVEFLFNKCSKQEELQLSNPSPAVVCGNGITTVQYTLRNSAYTDSLFRVEISDANGSFAQPINTGTVQLFNASGQTNLIIPAPTVVGNYLVRLVSVGGGIVSTTVEVNRRIAVEVGPITGTTTARLNETQTYQTSLPQGSTAIWEVTGGTIESGAGTNTITVKWVSAGTNNIKVKANDTCSNQTVLNVNVCEPINVGPVIGPTEAKLGDTVLYQTTNSSFSGYAWEISSNGKIISGLGTSQITVVWESGLLGTIRVIANVPCADTALYNTSLSGTGLNKVNENGVNIYPNPFNNQLLIEGLLEQTSITITNVTGVVVYHTEEQTSAQISTEELPSGVYYLRVKNEFGVKMIKVCKQ
jgi:hypothetical protein